MKLTIEQLDDLEALADLACNGTWSAGEPLAWKYYDERDIDRDDAYFVYACDPQTVKALIAMARESRGLEQQKLIKDAYDHGYQDAIKMSNLEAVES